MAKSTKIIFFATSLLQSAMNITQNSCQIFRLSGRRISGSILIFDYSGSRCTTVRQTVRCRRRWAVSYATTSGKLIFSNDWFLKNYPEKRAFLSFFLEMEEMKQRSFYILLRLKVFFLRSKNVRVITFSSFESNFGQKI